MGVLTRLGQPLIDLLAGQVNRAPGLDGQLFEPATSLAPPHGRYGIVHYGVMVPSLPAPLRSLDVVAVLGNPRVPIFDNNWLAQADPADSVYLLTGIGGAEYSEFASYSARQDCAFAADGSALRFGDDLDIDGSFPKFTVRRSHPRLGWVLDIRASDTVTHFAHLPGTYDHWSLLCEYDGSFVRDGVTTTASGLCTFEYARAVNLPLPFRFFTYQVLNVSADTQLLFGEVRGPGGVRLYRNAYVRTLGSPSRRYSRRLQHTVHAADQVSTPDGARMSLPRAWSWSVGDLLRVDAAANGDFVYGLGAGYAGSFDYDGRYAGEAISGTGYVEWIER
jgi:hypothetical protein